MLLFVIVLVCIVAGAFVVGAVIVLVILRVPDLVLYIGNCIVVTGNVTVIVIRMFLVIAIVINIGVSIRFLCSFFCCLLSF